MARLEQLLRLHAADPADAFVLYGIAQEHSAAGRHDEALEWFDRCLAADPAYCYAYYHKARSLEALGRREDALGALRAGSAAARMVGEGHAAVEIAAFLDELEG